MLTKASGICLCMLFVRTVFHFDLNIIIIIALLVSALGFSITLAGWMKLRVQIASGYLVPVIHACKSSHLVLFILALIHHSATHSCSQLSLSLYLIETLPYSSRQSCYTSQTDHSALNHTSASRHAHLSLPLCICVCLSVSHVIMSWTRQLMPRTTQEWDRR